jgi:hypothetical protein
MLAACGSSLLLLLLLVGNRACSSCSLLNAGRASQPQLLLLMLQMVLAQSARGWDVSHW